MNLRSRILTLNIFLLIALFVLVSRLFFFSILQSDKLYALAESQQQTTLQISAKRGEILFSDNSFLVANQPAFSAFLKKDSNQEITEDLIEKLATQIYSSVSFTATPSSQLSVQQKKDLIDKTKDILKQRLNNQHLAWVPIAKKITQERKQSLENLKIDNLIFEEDQTRIYPEASMSAHLLGFVGFNDLGQDQGFYGLEGYYQRELAGRPGIIRQEKDAFNQPILMGEYLDQTKKDGRSLKLHLNKSLQFLVETKLKKGIKQFEAQAGSVIVIDPYSGAILAMASFPNYDPNEYTKYNPKLFLNPIISKAFEPGSIFKVLVMAAALDSGAVQPDTKCDICHQPVKIDKYTIKTWNDEYQADANMTDIIVHSDNVGMVFIGQKLGLNKFLEYFEKFGFKQKTNIDLQDEVIVQPKPDKEWTYVDLATASFGQGFVATSMQLVQAVAAIANDGYLVQPQLVDQVIGENETIDISVKKKGQIISKKTADQVTEMMIAATKEGEAKWTNISGYEIAGKTGTAQIAVGGKYEEAKTNASFIGFAPANDPKFVMLVTLNQPSTSQWASETAAPLWFSIAQDLFNHFNIIPLHLGGVILKTPRYF